MKKILIKRACKNCKKQIIIINPLAWRRTYCTPKCRWTLRNKTYRLFWERKKLDKAAVREKGKKRCRICKHWYWHVGSHIVQRHNISIKGYRKKYEKKRKKEVPVNRRLHSQQKGRGLLPVGGDRKGAGEKGL